MRRKFPMNDMEKKSATKAARRISPVLILALSVLALGLLGWLMFGGSWAETDNSAARTPQSQPSSRLGRQEAEKWWEENQQKLFIVIEGEATLKVEGEGSGTVDGLAVYFRGNAEYFVQAKATFNLTSESMEVDFPKGGNLVVNDNARVVAQGVCDPLTVDVYGSVRFSGGGKFSVSGFKNVEASLLSDDLELNVRNCGEIFVGSNTVIEARDCKKAYIKDRAKGYIAGCETVYVEGNAVVFAEGCTTVYANGRSKVKVSGCDSVRKSDDAVLEKAD